MLTLRQKAKHKTEHEPDVWRTCAPECFATRTRWRCTCSTTSRISIKWYRDQGTDPISHKISYHKISQSLESARSDVESLVPLWNLTSVSVAVLLSHCPLYHVPKCRYTTCNHFLFTSSFKGLLSCHLLVSMSLLVNAYVATKSET